MCSTLQKRKLLPFQVEGPAAQISLPARKASAFPSNTSVTELRTAWTTLTRTTAVRRTSETAVLNRKTHKISPDSVLSYLFIICFKTTMWKSNHLSVVQTIHSALRRRVRTEPVIKTPNTATGCRTAEMAQMNSTAVSWKSINNYYVQYIIFFVYWCIFFFIIYSNFKI